MTPVPALYEDAIVVANICLLFPTDILLLALSLKTIPSLKLSLIICGVLVGAGVGGIDDVLTELTMETVVTDVVMTELTTETGEVTCHKLKQD